MNNAQEVKFTLKVMINEDKTKVLFAEAGSDFVDVLLSFLTLPLGTIIRVMNKHYQDKAPPVIGSMTNLYKSLGNLEKAYFWSEGGKQMLLNPRSSFESECRNLKLKIDDSQPAFYFRCDDRDCNRERRPFISMYHKMVKCDCGKSMSKAMGTMSGYKTVAENNIDGGVFAKKDFSFLITDDLRVTPVVPNSIMQTLINIGNITVSCGSELRTVTLGFNDIMDLLRGSLLSTTPLSDLILHKNCSDHDLVGVLLHRKEVVSSSSSSLSSSDDDYSKKKMTVKAWVQKSDCKFLFVIADEDFVDFLFGLLVLPLSGIESLLGGNTSLKNIDNLYGSIANLVDDHKYLCTPSTKNRLTKPELPPNYLSKNQIFSLGEQTNPNIFFFDSVIVSANERMEKGSWMRFKDPKGEKSYVKRPGKFIVGSNLTVWHWDSLDLILKMRNIRMSDVNELELHIGLEEGFNILKASLTSTTPLSDVFSNQILERIH